MIFLFVMPVSAAIMNYMLPLLIGASDVAFPTLNALSWWIFFFGGIYL
jgi:cytochrome c oxidase subunit 1